MVLPHLSCSTIGLVVRKEVHLTRATVYKYLAAESFPERHPRLPSAEIGKLIAPYTVYQGCQNAQQLYRETP